MTGMDAIEALAELARASSPAEAVEALHSVRAALGDNSEVYAPLLESLVVRAREVEQLRRLAGCDALTGVANRRTFSDALEREVALHARHKSQGLGVVLLDLDGLKALNDTFGHAAGDEAICAMAEACAATLRSTDLVARLGGDEFAVLLPSATFLETESVARRLRERIEAQVVAGQPLQVSIGIAASDVPPLSADELLVEADANLYADKRDRKATLRAVA